MVKTKAGMGDDYLKALAKMFKSNNDEAKKQGIITDYKILIGDAATQQDYDMLLMIQYPNMAALDGLRDKTDPRSTPRWSAARTRSAKRHVECLARLAHLMQTYPLALNIIRACWILFALIWLLAAFWTKRSVYQESRLQRMGYVIPLLVGGFLLAKGHRLSDPLNLRVIPQVEALAWIGVVLCVAGLALCIWARFTLGRNWSGVVTLKGGHELIVHGPYALVRHPIYTGLLTMFVATVVVRGHVAGIVAAPLVFVSIWIKLRHEEKLMLKQFPKEYAAYQQRVKRIIPFIL